MAYAPKPPKSPRPSLNSLLPTSDGRSIVVSGDRLTDDAKAEITESLNRPGAVVCLPSGWSVKLVGRDSCEYCGTGHGDTLATNCDSCGAPR